MTESLRDWTTAALGHDQSIEDEIGRGGMSVVYRARDLQQHVRDSPAVFADDQILRTAILDRMLHHVQVLHINGRSYRLRELGALLGPRPDSPMHPRTDARGASPR
jgi:hypothetical protein